MAEGDAAIGRMIDRVRTAGRMGELAAADVAAKVRKQVDEQLNSGNAPDGTPWQPTKAGTRPLQRAAAALEVVAVKTTILLRLTGHHVWHHFGTAKVPQRRVLPVGALPPSIAEAAKAGLVEFWRREVKG